MYFALYSGVSCFSPTSTQFSEQVLHDNFVQQVAGNLWEITAEFRNCEATILYNVFPHKVICNDVWPPTVLLIMHMLSTCCKLSAPATHHVLAHAIDLAQLMMLCAFKSFITGCTSQLVGAGIRTSIFNQCNNATVKTP